LGQWDLPRGDGLTWLCSDLESDFTHPSPDGECRRSQKQLLAFFKTDSITLPWYLKKAVPVDRPVRHCQHNEWHQPIDRHLFSESTSGTAPFRDVCLDVRRW
jgi:hypothetical protein